MNKDSILSRDIRFYEASKEVQHLQLLRCYPSEESLYKALCIAHDRVIQALRELETIWDES